MNINLMFWQRCHEKSLFMSLQLIISQLLPTSPILSLYDHLNSVNYFGVFNNFFSRQIDEIKIILTWLKVTGIQYLEVYFIWKWLETLINIHQLKERTSALKRFFVSLFILHLLVSIFLAKIIQPKIKDTHRKIRWKHKGVSSF